jgi:hypothetical protein
MTYKLNGVALDPQPTTGRWVLLEPLDEDGNGRPLYSGLMSFEMMWQLAAPTLFASLLSTWVQQSASGTVVADLPKYNSSTYTFYGYSGCILERPTIDPYFQQHETNVKLVVKNIHPLAVAAS